MKQLLTDWAVFSPWSKDVFKQIYKITIQSNISRNEVTWIMCWVTHPPQVTVHTLTLHLGIHLSRPDGLMCTLQSVHYQDVSKCAPKMCWITSSVCVCVCAITKVKDVHTTFKDFYEGKLHLQFISNLVHSRSVKSY